MYSQIDNLVRVYKPDGELHLLLAYLTGWAKSGRFSLSGRSAAIWVLQPHARVPVTGIPHSGTWRVKSDGSYVDAPGFPTTIKTQYPRSATAVMGPLTYSNNYSSVRCSQAWDAPSGLCGCVLAARLCHHCRTLRYAT